MSTESAVEIKINNMWNTKINFFFKILKIMENTKFDDFTNLGDFLISLASKDFEWADNVFQYFLSPSIIKVTVQEVTAVLQMILQEVINEPAITWSLVDAMDILITVGE